MEQKNLVYFYKKELNKNEEYFRTKTLLINLTDIFRGVNQLSYIKYYELLKKIEQIERESMHKAKKKYYKHIESI